MRVHDTEDPEAIVRHRLDRVAVKGQTLQIVELVQLLRLVEVSDVVTVHVERLEEGELKQVRLNRLKIVVRQIQPDQVLRVEHHVDEHGWQSSNRSNLIVLEEERVSLLLNNNLLLSLSLGLFNLASTHGTLLALQADVVVEQDLVDLLGLRCANN